LLPRRAKHGIRGKSGPSVERCGADASYGPTRPEWLRDRFDLRAVLHICVHFRSNFQRLARIGLAIGAFKKRLRHFAVGLGT